MGVGKGDRVGILLYNCLEYWALYFAAAKLGAIAVRLNFRLSTDEFEYALRDSGAKVLCFHSSLAGDLAPLRDAVPVEEYVCLEYGDDPRPDWALPWRVMQEASGGQLPRIEAGAQDPVMLMYTSGTTGRPKGALWTHDNTLWFSAVQVMKWGLASDTVCMTTGPLYHVGGMEDLALPTLLAGGTVIITRSGGFRIERVLEVVEETGVTECLLFPFMINDMLRSQRLSDFELESLRRIISGGEAVMPWAIEQLGERYPHVGLVQIYGLTEGSPIAASLDPEDAKTKGHTVGRPMPLTGVKVADEHGQELGVGEVGEVLTGGPVVCGEYWNKPEATAETFAGGWCRTGDLGRVDEDGYLTIAGRKKDMIRSGGENVYPVEVEDVLIRHPKIGDVAVIAVSDPDYTEAVCAVVVPAEGAEPTDTEVIEFCNGRIAGYKKPRKVTFVEEIPRTPSGKMQKYLLRDRYGTEPA